jgi:heme-degrading monooxygenase HmoA
LSYTTSEHYPLVRALEKQFHLLGRLFSIAQFGPQANKNEIHTRQPTHTSMSVFHPTTMVLPQPFYYMVVFTSLHQPHIVAENNDMTSGTGTSTKQNNNDSAPNTTTTPTQGEAANYAIAAKKIHELAQQQDGYLGDDSARGSDGLGITVSYWNSEEDIQNWKRNVDHVAAQTAGQQKWYADYHIHIARVERHYAMPSRGA